MSRINKIFALLFALTLAFSASAGEYIIDVSKIEKERRFAYEEICLQKL